MVIRRGGAPRAVDPRVVLAFAAIYFLWGATFLAIRIAVLQLPPLFTAGLRFLTAGSALYGFMRLRGAPNPTPLEWRSLAILALLMFVATYGPLFWAARYVTSGITSVIEATLPITALTFEVFIFRTHPPRWRQMVGILIGFSGVAVLLVHNEGQHVPVIPCLVVFVSGIAWSLGAVLSNQLALPKSRPVIAGGQMMLGGAVLLALSAMRGELRSPPHFTLHAALALAFLIVFGSLVAYTAYVWLLGRVSVTRVSSHAYVNPLVAVSLGYFIAGETVTLRTLAAALLIVSSVFLILSSEAVEDKDSKLPEAGVPGLAE